MSRSKADLIIQITKLYVHPKLNFAWAMGLTQHSIGILIQEWHQYYSWGSWKHGAGGANILRGHDNVQGK